MEIDNDLLMSAPGMGHRAYGTEQYIFKFLLTTAFWVLPVTCLPPDTWCLILYFCI